MLLYANIELGFFIVSDVADTYHQNLSDNRCGSVACRQGCDPNTGLCVCNHGYRLENGFECKAKYRDNIVIDKEGKDKG